MDKPEQRFNVDTRVKLREGVDPSLYGGYSRVGNEGWIRKRKRDKYGYPQVFIQWDKDHWSYNGQEDGWTWEGQFEAVEENQMAETEQPNERATQEEQVRAITESFVKSIFGALGMGSEQAASEPDQAPEAQSDTSEEEPETWDSLAAQTSEAISASPAYLTIALERVEAPGAPAMVIPRVFHAAQKTEYALIVQAHLAHVLASLQDATIAGVLEQATGEDQ